METRDSDIYKKYKSARNAVTREIRNIVRNEQHEVALQCKSNPKKFWNYINSKRKTKSTIVILLLQIIMATLSLRQTMNKKLRY